MTGRISWTMKVVFFLIAILAFANTIGALFYQNVLEDVYRIEFKDLGLLRLFGAYMAGVTLLLLLGVFSTNLQSIAHTVYAVLFSSVIAILVVVYDFLGTDMTDWVGYLVAGSVNLGIFILMLIGLAFRRK